jgi:endo-beta-N-acetylglucosaminidase D
MSRYETTPEILEQISEVTAVVATKLANGQYTYKAELTDGSEQSLMAASNKLYANVFFYSFWVNGNAKDNALNGHCSYGKNPQSYYRDKVIKAVPVVFEG